LTLDSAAFAHASSFQKVDGFLAFRSRQLELSLELAA
jgi:hypothetical protein